MRAGHAVLALTLLSCGARALVATPAVLEGLGDGASASSRSLSANVPRSLWELRSIYGDLVAADKLANGTYPRPANAGKVKMVVGIFTMVSHSLWTLNDREAKIRKIIRMSWMDHPDVCAWPNFTADCTIHVVFVASQGPSREARDKRFKVWLNRDGQTAHKGEVGEEFKSNERDVLLMPITENMNYGKTFEWFRVAARLFPGMDYIGKADTDVFLHVSSLIDNLPIPRTIHLEEEGCKVAAQVFLGKPWTCLANDNCPPQTCGPPAGRNFMAFNSNRSDCFTYMQGGFYAMSAPMVADMTAAGGYFEQNQVGPEDLQTGRAVAEYARRTGRCVAIWESEVFRHEKMFHHLRCADEFPGQVSREWDDYYDRESDWNKMQRRDHRRERLRDRWHRDRQDNTARRKGKKRSGPPPAPAMSKSASR